MYLYYIFYQNPLSRDLGKYVCDFQASQPITENSGETQLVNIPPIMRFLSGLVNYLDGPIEIAARKLYTSYQKFYTLGNYKFIMSEALFGREIRRIAGITTRRLTSGVIYQLDTEGIKVFLQESNKFDHDACFKLD